MAMIGGNAAVSQTINEDGTFEESETLSGLAGAIYTSIKASNLASYNATMASFDDAIALPRPHINETTSPKLSELRANLRQQKAEASLAIKQGWAKQANELGAPIVAYLQAEAELVTTNLKAQVSTSAVLGRTPNPNDPNTNIQPPSAAVDLPTAAVGGAVRIQ